MVRLATLGIAALSGLLIAGCAGGSFGSTGLSLPSADGVQTVSDAADALDAHRASATDNAKAAIAVTDALGSFVRDISADQRALAPSKFNETNAARRVRQAVREYAVQSNGKEIRSGSQLVVRTVPHGSEYCQSTAGYSVNGIPSLDQTFGWESGAFTGGTRTTDGRGSAIWWANASGAVVQAPIGALSITRTGARATCPMTTPAFILDGGRSENAFSIPVSMTFRRGQLASLTVTGARFADGASLAVTSGDRQPLEVYGIIADGRAQVATFRTDALGSGTLTITSTGAQYVIADWIVVGT
jgi:hypothetical protein